MRRAGSGDKAAFALLVRRHLARATALAQRIVGNRSDAEEIVQEAFLRCWQKAPEWRPANDRPSDGRAANAQAANDDDQKDGTRGSTAQFGTWLYRVLVNLCLDRRRRPQPIGIEAAAEVPDTAADGFQETSRGETSRRAWRNCPSASGLHWRSVTSRIWAISRRRRRWRSASAPWNPSWSERGVPCARLWEICRKKERRDDATESCS